MTRSISIAVVASSVLLGSTKIGGRLKADDGASRAAATANAHPSTDLGAQASRPLSNADIVAMTTAKLSDHVITTSVQRAATATFDVSQAALIGLKNAGVSDRSIQSMQEEAQQAMQGPGTATRQGIEGVLLTSRTRLISWTGRLRSGPAGPENRMPSCGRSRRTRYASQANC